MVYDHEAVAFPIHHGHCEYGAEHQPEEGKQQRPGHEIIHKHLFQNFKDIQIAVGVGLIFDTPAGFLDYAC